jgi:hypothetical protein
MPLNAPAGLPSLDFMSNNMYPQSQQDMTQYATPSQLPAGAQNIAMQTGYEAKTNPVTGELMDHYAKGGITSLEKKGSKPSEIITEDARKHNLDARPLLAQLQQEIQDGKTFLLQKNHSVMSFTSLPNDRSAVFSHIYTVDNPFTLVKSLRDFWHEIESSKEIKVVYGKADNPQILALGKKAGWPVEESDNPQFNWMART